MTLTAWTLAAMAALAPGRDHEVLGTAIARAAEAAPPLYANDDDRHRTVALLVAVAYRESTLVPDVVGDKGQSYCAFQIHRSSGGSEELLRDTDACARKGLAMLRQSIRTCREHPIAWYASGPTGCSNARAQRISRDRTSLAAWLVRTVRP